VLVNTGELIMSVGGVNGVSLGRGIAPKSQNTDKAQTRVTIFDNFETKFNSFVKETKSEYADAINGLNSEKNTASALNGNKANLSTNIFVLSQRKGDIGSKISELQAQKSRHSAKVHNSAIKSSLGSIDTSSIESQINYLQSKINTLVNIKASTAVSANSSASVAVDASQVASSSPAAAAAMAEGATTTKTTVTEDSAKITEETVKTETNQKHIDKQIVQLQEQIQRLELKLKRKENENDSQQIDNSYNTVDNFSLDMNLSVYNEEGSQIDLELSYKNEQFSSVVEKSSMTPAQIAKKLSEIAAKGGMFNRASQIDPNSEEAKKFLATTSR
jgi:hypothetical protein